MAESIISMIVADIGREAYTRLKNESKKKQLSPKKMFQTVEKHAAHRGLLSVAEWYVPKHKFYSPKAAKKYEEIMDKIEEKGGIDQLKGNELKKIIFNVFNLRIQEVGREESLKDFVYWYLKSYSVDSHDFTY